MAMKRVGVLYNPHSIISVEQSADVAVWLREQGLQVWHGVSQEGRDHPAEVANLDLMIAMGGDGTVLRAARLTYLHRTPVLPVALGHLSFMAEIGMEELFPALGILASGGGWRDERAMLEVELQREGQAISHLACLNEAVISRSDVSRIIKADVSIDGWPLTTYHADGVLVATATGSTGYALAAGGPIMDPRSRALALVPIAAHLTNVPSMILHEDAVLSILLRSRHHASLAVDGRENIPLQSGDIVQVRRSQYITTFARVGRTSSFYTQLDRRLRRDG